MDGRTATGKAAGVADVVAAAEEEVEEDFGEVGMVREVDSVVDMEVRVFQKFHFVKKKIVIPVRTPQGRI